MLNTSVKLDGFHVTNDSGKLIAKITWNSSEYNWHVKFANTFIPSCSYWNEREAAEYYILAQYIENRTSFD